MEAIFQQENINIDTPLHMHINVTDNDLIFPPHWHDAVEMFCVLEGQFALWVDGKRYILNKGDVFIVGSKVIHYFLKNDLAGKRIMFQFELSIFNQLCLEIEEYKSVYDLFRTGLFIGHEMEMLQRMLKDSLLEIYEEIQLQRRGYKCSLYSVMYKMVATMLREIPEELYVGQKAMQRERDYHILNQIFQFVKDNYQSSITISCIAKEIGFNPNYFIRYFKKHTGMTFIHYLQLYRLQIAKEMLLNSNDRIIDIAYRCGFNSIKTFNRLFKHQVGYSPTDYKRLVFEKV